MVPETNNYTRDEERKGKERRTKEDKAKQSLKSTNTALKECTLDLHRPMSICQSCTTQVFVGDFSCFQFLLGGEQCVLVIRVELKA